MDAGDNSNPCECSRADSTSTSRRMNHNVSDSENELDGRGTATFQNHSVPPYSQRQFPSPATRYIFPVPFDTLRLCSLLNSPPSTPQTDTLDATIAEMSADFDRFSNSPRQVEATRTPESDVPCTSISMLVHSSMESKATPEKRRRFKTPFTATQRLQEELYESLGEKPSNLVEENQLLFQTLDFERKRLILRKGLCAFMHGALMRQREKLEAAESRYKIKSEECAARLIFHTLLLQAYRRVQEQLNQLTAENSQLQKSVENLCLQLRVVRHLQNAEKERVVEKIHEIGNLKTELAYVKKILNKTKVELDKVGQECESLEKSNAELAEEKYKMQREQRLIEEKKEMLQGSLEMEKKRSEKQATALKELKRQVVDLRQQISDLIQQCDEFNEKARSFEAKNFDLQMQLESRGKEVIDLGQSRDSLKAEANALEQFTIALTSKNKNLATEMEKQEKATLNLKQRLNGAEANLRQQSGRIGVLEDEIGRMQLANLSMRSELESYELVEARRRRRWMNLTVGMMDPLAAIVSFFIGRPNEFIGWC